jgi:long-chain acyl-CoA synthetase
MAQETLYKVIGSVLCLLDVIWFYIRVLIYGKLAKPLELRDGITEPGAIPLNEPTKDNETKIYRNAIVYNKKRSIVCEGATTVDQLFSYLVKKNANEKCMGYRVYKTMHREKIDGKVFDIPEFEPEMKWMTYEQVGRRVRDLSCGLVELTKLNSGDKVAIYENTCPEWQIMAQACIRYGIIVVTVYASLGQEAIVKSLNETEITTILIGEDLLHNLNDIAASVPSLKYVIYNPATIKPNSFPISTLSKTLQVLSIEEVEKMGALNKKTPPIRKVPTEDDLALIMYTSG